MGNKIFFNEDEIEDIVDLYLNKFKPLSYISDKYGKDVSVIKRVLNENNIEIIFEDNCNGIYQKPIKLIFELEVSSHNDKSRGSGLAIAKMLVESKMGGSIEVENIENGAQFKLKLPKNI